MNSEASLSDAEAVAAVARDALDGQNTGADTTDPRHTVVLYECQSCCRAEVDTGAGAVVRGGLRLQHAQRRGRADVPG